MVKIDQDNFCYFPFMQMLLQPTGAFSPCCWNQEIVYGSLPEMDLLEAWNSQTAQKLRAEFLEGAPKSCAQQMRHMGCHRTSIRDFASELSLKSIQDRGPIRLDVRLNGQCNLQCVMCDVWKQPNGLYRNSDFWKIGPTEIFPFLREMDVLGGEPFVQKDTYRLIDEISSLNSECTWAFVTNGNFKFTESIYSRLNKIKIRWIQVSLDSLDVGTYSKIRINGNLVRALEAIHQLIRYRRLRAWENRGFRLTVSMCVQKLNLFEIPVFLDFCMEKRVDPILQFAYHPSEISLLDLPLSQVKEAISFLQELERTYGNRRIAPILVPIQEKFKENP